MVLAKALTLVFVWKNVGMGESVDGFYPTIWKERVGDYPGY
jgi:hypothetical protein